MSGKDYANEYPDCDLDIQQQLENEIQEAVWLLQRMMPQPWAEPYNSEVIERREAFLSRNKEKNQ